MLWMSQTSEIWKRNSYKLDCSKWIAQNSSLAMLLKVQSCNMPEIKILWWIPFAASTSKSASCNIYNNVPRCIYWKVPMFNSPVLMTCHRNVHKHCKPWMVSETVEILYKVQSIGAMMPTADESMIHQSSREWPKVHLYRALDMYKIVQVVPVLKCPSIRLPDKFLELERSKHWKHVAKVLTLEKKQSWNVHPCIRRVTSKLGSPAKLTNIALLRFSIRVKVTLQTLGPCLSGESLIAPLNFLHMNCRYFLIFGLPCASLRMAAKVFPRTVISLCPSIRQMTLPQCSRDWIPSTHKVRDPSERLVDKVIPRGDLATKDVPFQIFLSSKYTLMHLQSLVWKHRLRAWNQKSPHHRTLHTETQPANTKTPPPDGTAEDKKNSVWASHCLVTLHTFYRQILSLVDSFFLPETSAPGCPGTSTVYIYI